MARRYVHVIIIALVVTAALVAVFATRSDRRHDDRVTAAQTASRTFADIDYASTEAEMFRRSSLVIDAIPVGRPIFIPRTPDGDFGDFVQSLRVIDVLKGGAPAVVKVVRLGRAEVSRGFTEEEIGGPLPAGRAVYALQESAAAGEYQVVGHTQGALMLDEAGRVSAVGAEGFHNLIGATIAELKRRIQLTS